jgi:hypothetical protein
MLFCTVEKDLLAHAWRMLCVPTVWNFNTRIFHMLFFVVKNRPLYANFSILPCGNWCFSQGSTPLVCMKFCEHVPNSLWNKNLKRLIPNLLEKSEFFGLKNTALPLMHMEKKTFSSTLNIMISHMLTPKIPSAFFYQFLQFLTYLEEWKLEEVTHFSTKKSMKTWGSNHRILKLPCWTSTSKNYRSSFHGI